MKRWTLAMAVVFLVILALVGGASAANGVVQVAVLLDGSGSIDSQDFDVMLKGLADAAEDSACMPHDASVELTVIQFAGNLANGVEREVGPEVVTAANAGNLAAAILGISQGSGGTPIDAAFYEAVKALTGSPRFATAERQVINLSTDGEPEDEVAAEHRRDDAVAAGVDEIDAEAIGLGAPTAWLRDFIVYPQPGHLVAVDGYIPGWVATPADFEEYAASLCEKFQLIVPPEPEDEFVPEPGTLALLGSGLMGLAGYATLRWRTGE
jgi:uncharacterized protein YegL